MVTVTVENPCGCFFKSGMPEQIQCKNTFEAKMEAAQMLEQMQKNFCKKHTFRIIEALGQNKITIHIGPR